MKPNEINERESLHGMRIIAILAAVVIVACAVASLLASVWGG